MGLEQDRLLLIRAELSELLEALRLTSFESSPVQFLMRLEHIRKTAQSHRFDAVAEIASTFEATMQRVISNGGAHETIECFCGILDEAIGCKQLDSHIANSMLASVALRLGA